jgi:hypothetical protein
MPLDEKQKERLLIAGTLAAIVGIFVALRSKGGSVAGQSLAGTRAPTPGGPGGGSASNELGKAYLDYQFKNQQLVAQQANFQAQLASTDARATLNANTQIAIAKIGASSRLDSSLVGPVAGLAGKALDKFVPNPNPNANGTNNRLAPPTPPPAESVGPAGISGSALGISNYAAALAAAGGNVLGVDDPRSSNSIAKESQVFGPPTSPATPDTGYPSINGLVGDKSYQTTPILDFLTGATYDIPYESAGSVSPAYDSVGYSDYFSAPSGFSPSFPSLGYDYGPGGGVADLGNGGSADSGSNDTGYEA